MNRFKIPDAACTSQAFSHKVKFRFEIPALECSWAQHVQMWMLWLWGVMLSAPVVMTAPGFVQERELTCVPSHFKHILIALDVFGSFHGLSSLWHITLECMSQFQGPWWDPFDENKDAPSSKHSCSELNMSPQAPSMVCKGKLEALLGCALCLPPVCIFKIGQSCTLKMLIILVVPWSPLSPLCCVMLYIGAAERSFTCSSHCRDAVSIANKSISKNTVVVWLHLAWKAFTLSLHFSIFLLGWGKRKRQQQQRAIWEVDFQGNLKKKSKYSVLVCVLIHSFRLAVQVFRLPLVHYQSLVCSLRCRLNSNFSVVSFLLAICTL